MGNFWDDLSGDDEHAAEYMLSYGEGPGFKLRHEIGKLINDGESVLDVGCGPGWNKDHFDQYGPEVIYLGLDYSERFVRVANQRNPGSYTIGDVRNIHYDDNTWDVVIMQDVLEHTNGYEKPVKEALRVAIKRVILTFWHLADMDDPHINNDGNDGWGAWYDKRQLEKFLDSIGYTWLLHEVKTGGRLRHIYIIDKEEPK